MSKRGRKRQTVEERFWSKVHIPDVEGAEDECWEWTASKNAGGYGMFYKDGKNQLAHRVAYELEIEPIPEGMIIRHRCGNPSCINPRHLASDLRFSGMMSKAEEEKHTPEEISMRVLTGTWSKEKQEEIMRKLMPWRYDIWSG